MRLMAVRTCAAAARGATAGAGSRIRCRSSSSSSPRQQASAADASLSSVTKRRSDRQTRAFRTGAAVVLAVAAAPALFLHSAPGPNNNSNNSSESSTITRVLGVPDRLLALRLSALLATALYYSEARSEGGDDNSTSLEPTQIARILMGVASQLLDGDKDGADDAISGSSNNSSSSWGRGFQARVVEMLADIVLRADESSSQEDELLLRKLLDSGVVDALLQYLASSRPTSTTLIQSTSIVCFSYYEAYLLTHNNTHLLLYDYDFIF